MRRCFTLLTSMLVASASVLAPATAAGAVQTLAEVEVTRYGGADRYATSLLVAEAVAAHAGGTLDSVVMVSGLNWTDAVVAAPLAGSLGAPVLTTPPGTLRADATEFLQRTGVRHVLIVGADSDIAGVGPTVAASLEALGMTVDRVTRANQYATSVAAAQRLGEPGDMGILGRTAIVASGEVFADALVAGAFAARGPHPVLLTPPDRLHPGVASYLVSVGTEHVVVMGGTAALHQDVEDALIALGVEVTRLAGTSRYDTALKAAELVTHGYDRTCFTARRVALARAHVPFDSFSAAPLLARLCTPLLLADPDRIPAATADYLDDLRADIAPSGNDTLTAHVFGGNAAISDAAIETYLNSANSEVTCDIELGEEPAAVLGDLDASQLDWSPDCSRIAYISGDGIWTARVDGTDAVRLAGGSQPSWSPDGSRIAFSRLTGVWINDDEPVAHLFVTNADGTGEVQLTNSIATDVKPSWSPDNQRIVFERQNLDADPEDPDSGWRDRYVVVIDADGRNEAELRRGDGTATSPSWTPDGKRISFDDGLGLYTVLDDGTEEKPVWPVILSDLRFGDYEWSPDGCRIALVTRETLEDGRRVVAIKVINLEDSAVTTVISYTGPQSGYTVIQNPRWSPDGRSILFETSVNNTGARLGNFVARVPAA